MKLLKNICDSYKQWLENGQPKVFCACTCGGEIIIKRHHQWVGIPKYIRGHGVRINHPMSGKIPWNKNKKGLQSAWNKGLKTQSGEDNNFYGKHHTKESKQKIRENRPNQSGNKNPAWKGGVTPLNKLIRKCDKYKEWINNIFKRDNFICMMCNIRGSDLNAHHIKEFNKIIKENNIFILKDAINCNELWDINNGMTLCKKCHDKTKKKQK